jgi:hemolysin activation/secretion protein
MLGSSLLWPLLAQAADDDIVRFEIRQFQLQGNTLLSAGEVEAILKPYTGPVKDFGDAARAGNAGSGISATRLPPRYGGIAGTGTQWRRGQAACGGTRIGRVKVQNNQYFDEANIRRTLPTLEVGHTPNLSNVSANLKLMNENPAKNVTLKLQSGEVDEEVDAVLDVKDQRFWKAMLNLDNTGTEQTGKTHVSTVLQHANLFGLDHVASLQYTTRRKSLRVSKCMALATIFRCMRWAMRWICMQAIRTSIPARWRPAFQSGRERQRRYLWRTLHA